MQMSTVVLLLADLGLVLLVAMALGALAERVRLPAIAGQLLAGVVLGPTLFGALVPRVYGALFPHDAALKTVRTDFLQVGLLLFIFFVGLEIDVGLIRRRLRTIVPISVCGMVIPFVVGFAAVVLFPALWHGPNERALPYIIAVAVAISALPVIAAIIADLGLLRTQVGQIILSAAVIDDLCGWLGFAAVAAAFTPAVGHAQRPLWQLVIIVLGSFLLAVTVGRKLGAFAGTWVEHHARRATLGVGVCLALALLASAAMEGVGAHAFFGALLVGLALSGGHKEFLKPVERLVRAFFAPLYFGAVGLSVNVVANFDPVLVVLVFGIACLGKLIGVTLGGRLGRCSWRDSLAIASGMNARGAIEILLAVLALSLGLIDARIFVAIVIMALATSILAGFFLQAILHHKRPSERVKHKGPVLQHLDP